MKKPIEKSQQLFSQVPLDILGQELNEKDKQMLRSAIIAELDAISLYEQMANNTKNESLKKIFLDVAQEEKIHIGEFQQMLDSVDFEQVLSSAEGQQEVEEKLKNN